MKEDLNEMRDSIQEVIDRFSKKWFPNNTGYFPVEINIKVNHFPEYMLEVNAYPSIEEIANAGINLIANIAEVSITIKS